MISTISRDDTGRRERSGQGSGGADGHVAAVTVTAFSTSLQWMAIAWSEDELQGIVFGHPSRRQAEEALLRVQRLPRHACRVVAADELDDAPPWVRPLVDDLKRFADGEPVDFSDVPIAAAASDAVCAARGGGVPADWLGAGDVVRRIGGQVWCLRRGPRGGQRDGQESFSARRAVPPRAGCEREAGWLFGARRIADETAVVGDGSGAGVIEGTGLWSLRNAQY